MRFAALLLIGLPFSALAAPVFESVPAGDWRQWIEDAPPVCSAALPTAPLSVGQAVDLALCNNPQTREVWAAARAQAGLVGVARAAWLPSLTGGVGVSHSTGNDGFEKRDASLSLAWRLFDFGGRAAAEESARQVLSALSATRDATLQSLFLSAVQAFHGAQAAQAAVASALVAEAASRESFAAADTRYRVGAATPADRLQAQTALSQATLNRIRAEGEARNALGALASVMGFDANQPLAVAEFRTAVPDAALERDLAALIEEARTQRPDLRAAEAQWRAARANIDAARAGGLPTVSATAGPGWQNLAGTTTTGGSVGVSVSVPIFSGFETTYRIRSAEAVAAQREAQRERLRQQVALDVWRAYQSLATATQSLQTTADLVASAEAAERVALGRYKAGVGSMLDVLNAQSALAAARQQRIQASLDWHVFRATLAQAMGALDQRLTQPGEQP